MMIRGAAAVVFSALMFGSAGTAWAQGSLEPSGPPGPVMKSLAQVEPRRPVTNGMQSLSAPGSYYLTGTLTNGITIASDHVTLDLMGFGIHAFGNAISQSGGRSNVVIRNGHLSSAIANGIDLSVSPPGAMNLLENLRVGPCAIYGIAVGSDTLVRDCRVSGAAVAGVRVYGNATITDNVVKHCGKGLQASGQGACFRNNLVEGNADNFDFSIGNTLELLLAEIPETIDWPCVVRFAGPLAVGTAGITGITINAHDVTIDMGGHGLGGSGIFSGDGIAQSGDWSNLLVMNGSITNWRGFERSGLRAFGRNNIFRNLRLNDNYWAVNASGGGSLIEGCVAVENGANAIIGGPGSVIVNCSAVSNSMTGIRVTRGSSVRGCSSAYNRTGISADWSTVTDCSAYGNEQSGFTGGDSSYRGCTSSDNGLSGFSVVSSKLTDCLASGNGSNGIDAQGFCAVKACTVQGNGLSPSLSFVFGAGLRVRGRASRIEENLVVNNVVGVHVTSSSNFIARNTVVMNDTNWTVAANNFVLAVNGVQAGAFTGNTGGVSPGSADPNANFSY